MHVGLKATHEIHVTHEGNAAIPLGPDQRDRIWIGPHFLSPLIRRWGKMSLAFLNGLDLRRHRYGFIGQADWSMYPILHPGSLVLIDDSKRKIASDGWTNEIDRPIYFLEHREGYLCGWCSCTGDRLTIHSHPASHQRPLVYQHPAEIEVVGQVTGVAMLLESRKAPPCSKLSNSSSVSRSVRYSWRSTSRAVAGTSLRYGTHTWELADAQVLVQIGLLFG